MINLAYFEALSTPPKLSYSDFSSSIIMRQCQSTDPHDLEVFHRIRTPYDAQAFASALALHGLSNDYPCLVHNLLHGFPIGEMPVLDSTVVINNHPSCNEHLEEVLDYIGEEVAAGRMSGPYEQRRVEEILGGPFFASPLIVAVQKQEPGVPDKLRICRHLSKETKYDSSVNSYIEKEDFPTRFDTAMRVADMISAAPTGTQACTFDIKKFHRTVPVIPSHKPWLVIQGRKGEFFIDHCVPFGCASASSNAGMIANAGVDICHAERLRPSAKYEDDIKWFRTPSSQGPYGDGDYTYEYSGREVRERLESLGFPIHEEKGDEVFRSVTNFIGFTWDMDLKTVSLPEQKRLKFFRRTEDFINEFATSKCSRRDVERIHGSLCHVSFVHLEGRSRLSSLSNFTCKFDQREPFTRLYPPTSVLSDLRWWLNTLSMASGKRSIANRGVPQDHRIFVDASTSFGIGILVGEAWTRLKLSDNWKVEGRDICWLETVAVEILVYLIGEMGWDNRHVLVHSDNQGTIGALAKGRSPNRFLNSAIKRFYDFTVPRGLNISLVYVNTEVNPADPISRGQEGPGRRMMTKLKLPQELGDVLSFF